MNKFFNFIYPNNYARPSIHDQQLANSPLRTSKHPTHLTLQQRIALTSSPTRFSKREERGFLTKVLQYDSSVCCIHHNMSSLNLKLYNWPANYRAKLSVPAFVHNIASFNSGDFTLTILVFQELVLMKIGKFHPSLFLVKPRNEEDQIIFIPTIHT